MLHTDSQYFNDYGKLIPWKIPVDHKFVEFTKSILRKFFPGIKLTINNGKKIDDDYELQEIFTYGASDNAVFYYGKELQICHTCYPLKFSVPRSCIIKDDTASLHEPYTIQINDWAYENCYNKAINSIFEDWGKMIFFLLKVPLNSPMIVHSPYNELIKKIKINGIKDEKQDSSIHQDGEKVMAIKKDVQSEDIPAKKQVAIRNNIQGITIETNKNREENLERKEEVIWTFYTDGTENVYKGEKINDSGHYNVLLSNTGEKWQKEEDLTSNQAELKAVIAAMMISMKRKYKNVLIKTDSRNVLNWESGIWTAKSPNITNLVKILNKIKKKIPNLEIKYIPRDINLAHKL